MLHTPWIYPQQSGYILTRGTQKPLTICVINLFVVAKNDVVTVKKLAVSIALVYAVLCRAASSLTALVYAVLCRAASSLTALVYAVLCTAASSITSHLT
jgi:chloramphenicol O-acetyltransferase